MAQLMHEWMLVCALHYEDMQICSQLVRLMKVRAPENLFVP